MLYILIQICLRNNNKKGLIDKIFIEELHRKFEILILIKILVMFLNLCALIIKGFVKFRVDINSQNG